MVIMKKKISIYIEEKKKKRITKAKKIELICLNFYLGLLLPMRDGKWGTKVFIGVLVVKKRICSCKFTIYRYFFNFVCRGTTTPNP
jgi:hypothetical protein